MNIFDMRLFLYIHVDEKSSFQDNVDYFEKIMRRYFVQIAKKIASILPYKNQT